MFLTVSLPILVIFMAQFKNIFSKASSAVVLIFKILSGLVIFISLAILFLLNGFVFWPAALVGMVIVLMFFLSKIVKISNNNIVYPVTIFLFLVILLVLGNFNIFNLNLPAEVSLSRSASWNVSKNTLKYNPLLGSGPSTYYYDFSKYKSQDFNATPLWNVNFDSATGVIFEILATHGALGTISFLAIFATLLSLVFASITKSKDEEMRSIVLGLFASFVSIIILSLLFVTNNSIILIFFILAILTAAVAIVIYPENFKILKLSFKSTANHALTLALIFLSVSAGVVVLFTIGLKMYLGDVYASKALFVSDNSQKIDYLNKAIALSPYRDDYYSGLANAYMALANQAALNNGDQTEIQNNLSLAIENGKKSVDLNPKKEKTNESLALIYENASFYTRGALEWAENYYNKVIELDPHNPTPNLRIALINMARANAEQDKTEIENYINEAVKKYDESLAKKDDLAAAQYGKAIAYEKLGNIDSAIESLRNATILSRDNIDYRFELGRLYFNKGVTQPNIAQNATKEITTGEGEGGLSIETNQPAANVINKNAELTNAEQLFLSIINENPNHANGLYSLAILYQKTGEKENAKAAITRLLAILEEGPTKEAVKEQFKGLY
jgi:tetratricopeptide (TPR) repeat protein